MMRDNESRPHMLAHRECEELLPWLINETLGDEARVRIEAHLAGCDVCRAEAAEQAVLRQHIRREDAVVYAPHASLQKLMSRIDSTIPQQPATAVRPPRFVMPARSLAAAVLIAATIVIGIAGVTTWRAQDERLAPRYATLTSAADQRLDTPAARVVFAPGVNVSRLSELLRRYHARVVAGPSEAGVYTLTFGGADAAHDTGKSEQPPGTSDVTSMQQLVMTSIEQLRREPEVLFVEPVMSSGDRR